VLLERRLQLERLGTVFAAVWPLVRMRRQVVLEAGHLAKGLRAYRAHERLVARVNAQVLPQNVLGLERLVAYLARVFDVLVVFDFLLCDDGRRGPRRG
jgi:hypothetical protein